MRIPKAIQNLIDSFEKLPGIGPRTAQRLTFYLLHVPQAELEGFAASLTNLKKQTVLCGICKNVSESDPCSICADGSRDIHTIMIVEESLDILSLERSGKYRGLYHVLHGSINPIENIGPDELYIEPFFDRLGNGNPEVREVIIATNPTMEGEATAMYIRNKMMLMTKEREVKITRLGMGIPTGASLEYADDMTLTQAIEGRREF